VPSREGNGNRVLPSGRLFTLAPVANEDCGEGASRGCADGLQISAVQQHLAPTGACQVTDEAAQPERHTRSPTVTVTAPK